MRSQESEVVNLRAWPDWEDVWHTKTGLVAEMKAITFELSKGRGDTVHKNPTFFQSKTTHSCHRFPMRRAAKKKSEWKRPGRPARLRVRVPLLENVCPSCRVCAFVRLFRNIRLTPEINPFERTAKKWRSDARKSDGVFDLPANQCATSVLGERPAPEPLAPEELCLQKARLMRWPMPTICQRNLEEALEVWMCIDYT